VQDSVAKEILAAKEIQAAKLGNAPAPAPAPPAGAPKPSPAPAPREAAPAQGTGPAVRPLGTSTGAYLKQVVLDEEDSRLLENAAKVGLPPPPPSRGSPMPRNGLG
jgi:hypothetical protein